MNTSPAMWDIPPPPGTEEDRQRGGDSVVVAPEDPPRQATAKKRHRSRSRSRDRRHVRRRSRSRRRTRSRSRSRRRSRSRSRRRRRKQHSSSRSRSRTPPRRRHSGRPPTRRRRSHSRSRSRTRSSHHRTHRAGGARRDRTRSKSRRRSFSDEYYHTDDTDRAVDVKLERDEEDDDEEEDASPPKDNVFKNDGSFLEMFKKLQEQQKETVPPPEEPKRPVLPAFGKRRGGKVLKTGMVQKVRQQNEEENVTDAWSVYMKEVRKYKEACCDDDSKTRPLVKVKMPVAIKAEDIKTAPYDPRFPNTNQTRYCYQSYVDYYRCQKVRGADYKPCEYFSKVFHSMCPNSWIEKWDSQREEGTFPGNI